MDTSWEEVALGSSGPFGNIARNESGQLQVAVSSMVSTELVLS